MRRTAAYVAALLGSGIAATVLGVVLAGGQGGPPSVIAVAAVPAGQFAPNQAQSLIDGARSHQAALLLLYSASWQQGAAAEQALGGYIPPKPAPKPKPVCTPVTSSGTTSKKPSTGTGAAKSASATPTKSAVHCHTPPVPTPTGTTVPMALGPLDVAVVTADSQAAAISQLPRTAEVIGLSGNVLRSGSAPGGPGLLLLLWGCLLLVFCWLAVRGVMLLRTQQRRMPAPPRRASAPGLGRSPGPAPGPPARPAPGAAVLSDRGPPPSAVSPVPSGNSATDTLRDQRLVASILDGYLPTDPLERWDPQCPRCGSFRVERTEETGQCRACGQLWPWASPADWPDVVVSPRLRGPVRRTR